MFFIASEPFKNPTSKSQIEREPSRADNIWPGLILFSARLQYCVIVMNRAYSILRCLPDKNKVGYRTDLLITTIMNLRRPQESLANCCWLPRMTDKVRASQQGNFPFLYRVSLGSPIGVDGYFLRHFRLSFRQFRNAVIETRTDKDLEHWFLGQPGVNSLAISSWNDFAPKLGTPGYPVSFLRHIIKWFVYPKSIKQPVNSLFEMIEQDEAL